MTLEAVALDAMGVLYEQGDDVAELLVPYLRRCGSVAAVGDIEAWYTAASLGQLTSGEFWALTGVRERASDKDYCDLHSLAAGVPEFLAAAGAAGIRVACLSNDVSAWSRLLRERFGLSAAIGTPVISGEVGVRKPDPEIYREMLRRLDTTADRVLFVDDREKNIAAARDLDFPTVHFGVDVTSFAALTRTVTSWRSTSLCTRKGARTG